MLTIETLEEFDLRDLRVYGENSRPVVFEEIELQKEAREWLCLNIPISVSSVERVETLTFSLQIISGVHRRLHDLNPPFRRQSPR
jgi:hypothetical protein